MHVSNQRGSTAWAKAVRRCSQAKAGIEAEWVGILRDLDALAETGMDDGGRRFLLRSRAKGDTVSILSCV